MSLRPGTRAAPDSEPSPPARRVRWYVWRGLAAFATAFALNSWAVPRGHLWLAYVGFVLGLFGILLLTTAAAHANARRRARFREWFEREYAKNEQAAAERERRPPSS